MVIAACQRKLGMPFLIRKYKEVKLQSVLENIKIRLVVVMGIVGELLKYGGSGLVNFFEQLFGTRPYC